MKDIQSQQKWNKLYQSSDIEIGEPVWVLREFAHLLPKEGKGLELACGKASNGIFLALEGMDVEAWDISDVVVEKLNQFAKAKKLSLTALAKDLTAPSIPESTFDVIVVSHFLDRALTPMIVKALRPGGLLYYQTFVKDVTPSYTGPGNPDFRLDKNELLRMFSDLSLVAYREEGVIGDVENGLRNSAAIVAQRDLV